jgi:hypothetical protein
MATMLGSSTTTLSLWMISVLAVPRSMAISWVKNPENQLMGEGQCLKCLLPVMHMAIPSRSQVSMLSWSRMLPPGLYDGT